MYKNRSMKIQLNLKQYDEQMTCKVPSISCSQLSLDLPKEDVEYRKRFELKNKAKGQINKPISRQKLLSELTKLVAQNKKRLEHLNKRSKKNK